MTPRQFGALLCLDEDYIVGCITELRNCVSYIYIYICIYIYYRTLISLIDFGFTITRLVLAVIADNACYSKTALPFVVCTKKISRSMRGTV